MHRGIRKCKWIIVGIFVMLLAVFAALKVYGETKVEYCKNIISYGNGYAAIYESDWITSVVTFDSNGETGQKAAAFHSNPVLAKEYNYKTIFEENGGLYVLVCEYGSGSSQKWSIKKCNFTWGTFSTEWELKEQEGYAFISASLPRIINGELYVAYTDKNTGDAVTFKVTKDGRYEIVSRTRLPDNAIIEKAIYTSDGTIAVTTCYGMFLGDKRLYPRQGDADCMLGGIAYEGDTVKTVDVNTDQLISYVGKENAVKVTKLNMGDYSRFQSIRVNPDDSITCAYESGSTLYGCHVNGGEKKIFDKLGKGVFWGAAIREGIIIELIYILAVLLFAAVNRLAKKKNGVDKQKNFTGLSMRATIVSIEIMVLFMVIFMRDDFQDFFSISSSWKQENVDNAAENFAAYAARNVQIGMRDGMPCMREEDYKAFVKMLGRYEETVQDFGGESYEVCIFALHEGRTYCIYSAEFSGAIPAELGVSRNAADAGLSAMEGFEKIKYEDKRSIGRLTYYNHPFDANLEGGGKVRLSMSIVTDGYQEKAEAYRLVLMVIAFSLAIDVLFVVILNLSVGSMLRRIRRLSVNLKEYNETKNPEFIISNGSDEIAQTAQAIKTMAQGLEIYEKDLNESNANYRKLLPTGILKVMGHDRISQVKPNESVKKQASVIYLSFYGADRKQMLEKIIELAEKNGDIIAEFDYDRICIVIGDTNKEQNVKKQYEELSGGYADIEFAKEERIFASVGNEKNAYLISMKKTGQLPAGGDITDDEKCCI